MSADTTIRQARPRRGRRPARGVKSWRRADGFQRRLRTMLASRDKDDPESLTEVTFGLFAAAEEFLERPLSRAERMQLATQVRTAKPSEIMRLLHQWRGSLTDRAVRTLQRREDVEALCWA